MLNDNLDDLIVFAKVADAKSFSAAANSLGMVKSMVSKRISRLEKNLGVTLIHRSTRSMSLTEEGLTLYEYTSRIQDELTGARQALMTTTDELSGFLRIMSPLSFGNYYLSRMLSKFLQAHEGMKVEMILSSHLMDLNAAGIDMAIHVGRPPDSSYLSRKITTSHMRVCGSPAYFEKHGTPKTLADLADHNCLVHRHLPENNVWTFHEGKKEVKVKVKSSFVANSSQSLKQAAMSGLGIVMLPDYVFKTELSQHLLVPVLDEFCTQKISVFALFPYTKHVTPKVRVFIDFLIEQFKLSDS